MALAHCHAARHRLDRTAPDRKPKDPPMQRPPPSSSPPGAVCGRAAPSPSNGACWPVDRCWSARWRPSARRRRSIGSSWSSILTTWRRAAPLLSERVEAVGRRGTPRRLGAQRAGGAGGQRDRAGADPRRRPAAGLAGADRAAGRGARQRPGRRPGAAGHRRAVARRRGPGRRPRRPRRPLPRPDPAGVPLRGDPRRPPRPCRRRRRRCRGRARRRT